MQLSIPELTAAQDVLRKAENGLATIRDIFLVGGYTEGATRANDISGRLGDLIDAIERLIATTPGAKP